MCYYYRQMQIATCTLDNMNYNSKTRTKYYPTKTRNIEVSISELDSIVTAQGGGQTCLHNSLCNIIFISSSKIIEMMTMLSRLTIFIWLCKFSCFLLLTSKRKLESPTGRIIHGQMSKISRYLSKISRHKPQNRRAAN